MARLSSNQLGGKKSINGKVALLSLAVLMALVCVNLVFLIDRGAEIETHQLSLKKVKKINSYWWPSAETGGGLLGKMYRAQHPLDCSSPTTKFLVWRSMKDSEKDTRGLTAWAHAGASHLLHALTNGDQFETFGSRVLITDDKLWPMAKGCLNGPETRECYFEPLTNCKLSEVDGVSSTGSVKVELAQNGDEYDRKARVVYTSQSDPWFRPIGAKYAWTGLPGGDGKHPDMAVFASGIAYYFRPLKWLRQEIDSRIRRSIPPDLDPSRTLGERSVLKNPDIAAEKPQAHVIPSGVPIRRSDKCKGHNLKGSAAGELECPPLNDYLGGVKSFLEFDPLIENIIVTSEDKEACDEFIQMVQKEVPKLRVIQNVGDVQQGTGSGSKLEAYFEKTSNNNVIPSALTSMHLHLRAQYFVITSKSTWTNTIAGWLFMSCLTLSQIVTPHNFFVSP
ncbi:hypothetical protein ACHAXT_004805 [Thalassiosira profunda]